VKEESIHHKTNRVLPFFGWFAAGLPKKARSLRYFYSVLSQTSDNCKLPDTTIIGRKLLFIMMIIIIIMV
jgi:hypothetical protein